MQRCTTHPRFAWRGTIPIFDVALIRLSAPVPNGTAVPIAIAPAGFDALALGGLGATLTVAGYGSTSATSASLSYPLAMQTSLAIRPTSECANAYRVWDAV